MNAEAKSENRPNPLNKMFNKFCLPIASFSWEIIARHTEAIATKKPLRETPITLSNSGSRGTFITSSVKSSTSLFRIIFLIFLSTAAIRRVDEFTFLSRKILSALSAEGEYFRSRSQSSYNLIQHVKNMISNKSFEFINTSYCLNC